jgi:hypothetical protein
MSPHAVDLRTNQNAQPGAEGRRQFLGVKISGSTPGYGEQHGQNRMASKASHDFTPAGSSSAHPGPPGTGKGPGPAYQREP